jgi:hypothetical protein
MIILFLLQVNICGGCCFTTSTKSVVRIATDNTVIDLLPTSVKRGGYGNKRTVFCGPYTCKIGFPKFSSGFQIEERLRQTCTLFNLLQDERTVGGLITLDDVLSTTNDILQPLLLGKDFPPGVAFTPAHLKVLQANERRHMSGKKVSLNFVFIAFSNH